jgi:SAM-dependent methyltransferase
VTVTSNFSGISEAKVEGLRQADPAIAAIRSRSGRISFDWLRESFKQDHDIKDSLRYGKAILKKIDQIDQYLYTYGKMIQSQWAEVLKGFTVNTTPVRIADYGCGQGLAGIMLADRLGADFCAKVREVILIEPSSVALVRAEAVYRSLFPAASISCVRKSLDDVERSDFPDSKLRTVHLFSNVLDITGFKIGKIFSVGLTKGDHTILAVSHDREFAGGAARLEAIKREIDKDEYRKWILIRSSRIRRFKCGDGGKFAAISWIADLGIRHG